MTEDRDNPRAVTHEELALSNMLQLEALCRILRDKGLLTSEELAQAVADVKREMDERRRRN